MRNLLTFITVFFICAALSAQGRYLTKNGTITFEGSVPSFEEVKANNSTVTAILNTENGEFAALALIKGFRFKVALMEEHFNENYIESDDFPKAIFKGKLEGFDLGSLTDKKQTFKLSGDLTIHGKTKAMTTPVTLKKEGNIIFMSGKFVAQAEDFDIKVPKIVRNKVAEEIEIGVDFELKAKK